VRKSFPEKPYTVTNIDVVWEMDVADLSSLSKYNDKYKYTIKRNRKISPYAWSVI